MASTSSTSRSRAPAATISAIPSTPPSGVGVGSSSSSSDQAIGVTEKSTSAGTAMATATLVHAPSTAMLAWLFVSLPVVVWDGGYVFGRPYTMPGGFLHRPLWEPYALYGSVDLVYGRKTFEDGEGFIGAQSSMNIIETVLYCFYLWMWFANASPSSSSKGKGKGKNKKRKVLKGKLAGQAVLACFTAAVMTLSKTALYFLNEYHSSFANTRHNGPLSLIFFWIIPNGVWLVFPAHFVYELGGEIMDAIAAEPIKMS